MRKITEPKIILPWIAFIVATLTNSCSLGGASLEAHRYESPSEYYLYLPEGYTEDVKWPVFVGVHGSGGSGKDCWSMWQRFADKEGFILLCPSLSDEGGGWYQEDGEAMVAAILNQIYLDYSIENRVFMAGFSAGAQFVQGFAFDIPSYVFAVSMLSATIYYPPSPASSHIPFLVTIGDHESPETIQAARNLAGYLNSNGNHVEFYILEGVGHFASEEAVDLTIDFFRRTTDTFY
jgi:poly(3-hydroxybutyrate) depolymerase